MSREDVQNTADNLERVPRDPKIARPNDAPEGDAVPEDIPQEDGPAGPPDAGDEWAAKCAEAAHFARNDVGNAKRFACYFADRVIYVPRVGWHLYDDTRWRLDPDKLAARLKAQRVQELMLTEAHYLPRTFWQERMIARDAAVTERLAELDALESLGETERGEHDALTKERREIDKALGQVSRARSDHINFARSTGNTSKINNMLEEVSVTLARDVDDLDADPLTVNVQNGILRFTVDKGAGDGSSKTADFKLEPHAREVAVSGRAAPQYITKLMTAGYDPLATCPQFDAFLERVLPNPAMRDFVLRYFGLALTGLKFQGFLFLFGEGANGKSVLVNLMAKIAGDYASKAKIESLTGQNKRGGGDATPDLMGLIGARLAHAAEPEEGERFQEAVIKELTGGDSILARHLHSDFIEVNPEFKLVISGNHKPEIRGTDAGIWRRVKLVPFEVQIPADERDEKLIDKLFAERDGILNRLIDGLLDYLEAGLQEPAGVTQAVEDYRAESDPIGAFLSECCTVDGSDRYIEAGYLVRAFNYWLLLQGDAPWLRKASNAFRDRAGKWKHPKTQLAYTRVKHKSLVYRGLQFTNDFAELLEAAVDDGRGGLKRPSTGAGA